MIITMRSALLVKRVKMLLSKLHPVLTYLCPDGSAAMDTRILCQ